MDTNKPPEKTDKQKEQLGKASAEQARTGHAPVPDPHVPLDEAMPAQNPQPMQPTGAPPPLLRTTIASQADAPPAGSGGRVFSESVTSSVPGSASTEAGEQPSAPAGSLGDSSGMPGDVVTISGSGFGKEQDPESHVWFTGVNGLIMAGVARWTDEEIDVHVPNGAQTGPVVLKIAGQKEVVLGDFSVDNDDDEKKDREAKAKQVNERNAKVAQQASTEAAAKRVSDRKDAAKHR